MKNESQKQDLNNWNVKSELKNRNNRQMLNPNISKRGIMNSMNIYSTNQNFHNFHDNLRNVKAAILKSSKPQ